MSKYHYHLVEITRFWHGPIPRIQKTSGTHLYLTYNMAWKAGRREYPPAIVQIEIEEWRWLYNRFKRDWDIERCTLLPPRLDGTVWHKVV